MKNRHLEAAWAYHNGTKHSYQSIHTNPHYLDWEIQPLPFKIYPKLEAIPLTHHLSFSGVAALSAIAETGSQSESNFVPGKDTLAELLRLSAGITKRKSYPGGEMLFRAAACTGALYHIDLYIVCGELPDLKPGVYHFGPHDFALRRLRDGDYRAVIVGATGRNPAVARAPVIVVCTSTYWRNAWKYQARTYRHCYWDNGTILANLLAAAVARGLAAQVVAGFVDESVNRLLGLDTEREAALSLVSLGNIPATTSGPTPKVEPLELETVPLSQREVDYPAIRAMHAGSTLENEDEVVAWCREHSVETLGEKSRQTSGRIFPLRPLGDQEISGDSVEEVILRRGSTRQFSQESISFAQLSTMLCQATRGIPADFLDRGQTLNQLYLI
ncbi:MAG: SagB/ThcOx family dehydrogenase, partial [Candidatus Binatia bacterium]